MKTQLRGLLVTALLAAIYVALPLEPLFAVTPDDEPGWNDNGVGVEIWVPIPGDKDHFGQLPAAVPTDRFIYEARYACTDGDINIFPECTEVISECSNVANSPDGKPGTVIYWYRASRDVVPPVW